MFWHSTSCCSSELDSSLHCIFCLCGFLVKLYPSVHHFNMFASYFLLSCTCVRGWKVGRLICTMKCCWNPTPLRMKMENLLKVLKPHATMHVFQRRLFYLFLPKPFSPPQFLLLCCIMKKFCVSGEFRAPSSRGSLYQKVRQQQSNTGEVTVEPGKLRPRHEYAHQHTQPPQACPVWAWMLFTNWHSTVAQQGPADNLHNNLLLPNFTFDVECNIVITHNCFFHLSQATIRRIKLKVFNFGSNNWKMTQLSSCI